MTWQERHFITAAACRTDTESETLPPKLLTASGLSCLIAAIWRLFTLASKTNLNNCSTYSCRISTNQSSLVLLIIEG